MKSDLRNDNRRRVPPPVTQVAADTGNLSRSPDFSILVISVLLTCFGIVMVTAASGLFTLGKQGAGMSYLSRELYGVVVAWGAMIFTACIDYRAYKKLAIPIAGAAVFALLLVMIPGLGAEINGARRWIKLGGFMFQAGELAKIAVIIIVAVILSEMNEKIGDIRTLGMVYAVVGGAAVLLMLQPDFGMTILIAVVATAMLFIAGAKPLHLGGVGILGVAFCVFFIFTEEYRRQRILGFLNPYENASDSGYQVLQSLIAVASGGFFGRGLGESRQVSFLPQFNTDFIISITIEQLGIVTLFIVVCLFAAFTYRGFKIASRCVDPLASYLAFGIVFMISMQAVMNIAVALGCMPVTGLTLPFISYGGSSLMMLCASVGILLNISMHSMATTGRRNEKVCGSGWGNRRPPVRGGSPSASLPPNRT